MFRDDLGSAATLTLRCPALALGALPRAARLRWAMLNSVPPSDTALLAPELVAELSAVGRARSSLSAARVERTRSAKSLEATGLFVR